MTATLRRSMRSSLGRIPPVVRMGAGSFVVQGAAAVVAALVQLLLTRSLGVDEYGDYFYALNWVTFLSLVGLVGYDTLSLRMVAAYRATERWDSLRGFLRFSLGVTLAGSTVLVALFLAGVALFAGRLGSGFLAAALLAAALLPLLGVSKLLVAWVLGLRRAVAALVVPTVLQPMLFGTLVMAAFFGAGIPRLASTAMGLQLGASLAAVAATAVIARRLFPAPVWRAAPRMVPGEWMRLAAPHLVIGMSQVVLVQVDALMVGLLLSTREAGIFGIAAKLASLVGFAIGAVNAVVAPAMSELHTRGDRRGLRRVVRGSAAATLGYAVLFGAALAFWRVPVLGLFGSEFRTGGGPMLLLIAAHVVAAAYGSVGFLLTMTGHEAAASRAIVGAAGLDVVLNWLLIPPFGLWGAAGATLVAVAVRNVWLGALARRHLNIRPLRDLLRLGRAQSVDR